MIGKKMYFLSPFFIEKGKAGQSHGKRYIGYTYNSAM